jgi:3-deoxy-D-manno-octulosonate 8-phosphate phosphatase (KDO 8-P phosphatase)
MNQRAVFDDKARQLKLLILDVDCVLTDGRLFFDHQQREYKFFHARDGHGIKLLRQTGVEVAAVSGRTSATVEQRLKSLGISHIYQGQEDKTIAFEQLLKALNITPEQTAHMGDDVIDLPIMKRAGLAIAVNDAHFAVKAYADYCTELPGGAGAVREVCDGIMQAQGTLQAIIDSYLV